MRTMLSQTWVTILDPFGVVDHLGRSLQERQEDTLLGGSLPCKGLRGWATTPRRWSWDEEGSELLLCDPRV